MSQIASIFARVAQEDGYVPHETLSAVDVVTRFVLAPIGIFALIAVIVFALTAERKKGGQSVITHIE